MPDFDVVVIGSGFAGLAAAITARTNGASVILVEGSTVVGGSSGLSGGKVMGAGTRIQRSHGIEDDPAELYRFYMALNRYLLEPSVIRALAEESGPTVDWLEDLGVEFDSRLMTAGEEKTARMHITVGEGHSIVSRLVAHAKRIGVEFAMGKQVDRLIVDQDSHVVGIAAGDDELLASAVIIATGGFGASRELVERFLPRLADDDWWWYIGASTSTGTAFGLGAQVGAQVAGHGRSARLITPNFGNVLEGGYLPGWLIVVNSDARRFYDETSSYSVTPGIVEAQSGPIFAIFDEASKIASNPESVELAKKTSVGRRDGRAQKWVAGSIDEQVGRGTVLTAHSVEELATALGISPSGLRATIDSYNQDVESGCDSHFLKSPRVLRRIESPPFYATELRLSHLAVTGFGLRIDSQARVLSESGAPIAGLFAAGECTGGVIGETYVGSGNSITSAFVFGRIAGRTAAKKGSA